jgi:hypothetical protein
MLHRLKIVLVRQIGGPLRGTCGVRGEQDGGNHQCAKNLVHA